MWPIKFEIWVKPVGEDAMLAFHWSRDEASGIERAKADATKFGYEIEQVWAVPYKESKE